jgi:predicted adenine nucleotide alpha hydrolase (AANH) superfamily ATPase
MEKPSIAINTEYLEYKKRKEEDKNFLKLLGVTVLAGLTSPQWLPVAEKAVEVGKEIGKILMSGK